MIFGLHWVTPIGSLQPDRSRLAEFKAWSSRGNANLSLTSRIKCGGGGILKF